VFEELGVVQKYAKSMGLQGISVPESGQKISTRREQQRPQRRQQKSRSQDTVKNQANFERSHRSASVDHSLHADSPQAFQPPVPGSAKNKKPSIRSVDLPPKPYSDYQAASYRQPSPTIKAPERATKSKPRQPLKHGTQQRSRVHPSQPQKRQKPAPILYGLRLLILGVGIGAIAGTLLSVLDPTSRIGTDNSIALEKTQQQQATVEVKLPALKLSQEIMPLKTAVQQLAAKNAKLIPGMFFVDLDTGGYIDLNSNLTFSAASMIKVPVLVAFFQDVDAGKIRLDEKLTMTKEVIGGGSGDMQYKPVGTKFTALETANRMIVISDNTATNMLIARMGGAAALNQRFQSWGLTVTQIQNLLPDLSGTNTTSPRDLGQLMALVNQGDLMSLRSRDRLLEIMRRTKTRTLLPRGLGSGSIIAHKTGDIGSMVGDVGLIDMPSGKRYIGVAMVKRPHNDNRAQELIRQTSRAVYQQFNQPTVPQIMPTTPFVTTNPPGSAGEIRR
jgi:beta-lactamase class A